MKKKKIRNNLLHHFALLDAFAVLFLPGWDFVFPLQPTLWAESLCDVMNNMFPLFLLLLAAHHPRFRDFVAELSPRLSVGAKGLCWHARLFR